MAESSQPKNRNKGQPKSIGQKALSALVEFCAFTFWAYAVIKLFVFDVDVWAANLISPGADWVLSYKFPILIGLIAIALITTRSKTLALNILYIAAYPFIALLFKIPFLILRQRSWLLAFSIFNVSIGLFQSFKRNFILSATFFLSAVIIANVQFPAVLWAAITAILLTLSIAYAFALIKSFKPSPVFEMYQKIFPRIRRQKIFKVDPALQNIPVRKLTTDQLLLRTKAIQNAVLYNRVCFFVAKQLRDFQKSRVNIITSTLGLVGLLMFTVLSFALINFAAFKIDPTLFQFIYAPPTFFSFLYYSAGSMFYASNGLVPVAAISQAFQLLEFFFAVILLVILGAVLLTMKNERYASDLNQVVETVETEGRAMEASLRDDFNIASIAKAIESLEKAKSDLLGLILIVTKGIGED